MRTIKFTAHFGNQEKTVELTEPVGMSGAGWQIMIDKYYQGVMVKYQGQWVGHLNDRSTLTADDIQALGERIDEVYPE